MLSNQSLKMFFYERVRELQEIHTEHKSFMSRSVRQNAWCQNQDERKLASIKSIYELNVVLFKIFSGP